MWNPPLPEGLKREIISAIDRLSQPIVGSSIDLLGAHGSVPIQNDLILDWVRFLVPPPSRRDDI
jgi:hypothetical protein